MDAEKRKLIQQLEELGQVTFVKKSGKPIRGICLLLFKVRYKWFRKCFK